MNIIEAVKDILNNYPKILEFTNDVHVDFTEDTPTNFGLSSTGDSLINEDVLGNQIRQHNFVLYAINQAFNDYERLANSTFLLDLSYWLEHYSLENPIEVFIDGITVNGKLIKLSCANGMIYSFQEGTLTGPVTYQMQIYAQYKLESEVL